MEAALAAVRQDYPGARSEPDLAAFHAGDTHVFYDPGTHLVVLVGPDEHADGHVEGIVETCPGHELAAHPSFFETMEGSVATGWGADNARARKALEAMTRIYVAAQRSRGLGSIGPTGDVVTDVHLPLDLAITRLREQMFVLEAVQVRFLRDVFAEAASDKDREALADRLGLDHGTWLRMLAKDHRRFGTLT